MGTVVPKIGYRWLGSPFRGLPSLIGERVGEEPHEQSKEMILKNIYWRDEAACGAAPQGMGDQRDGEPGVRALERYSLFIGTYCDSCPVAQECLDDSVFTGADGRQADDARWTVRGGYLPTAITVTPQGRPIGSTLDDWEPKPPPVILPLSFADTRIPMIEKGVCNKGLHGILADEDLYLKSNSDGPRQSECRECRRIRDRKRYPKNKDAKMAA